MPDTAITGKPYTLLGPDGPYQSPSKGTLGGNRQLKIYGCLNCWSARRALPGYAAVRVFFADEATAIATGYRPCGHCMRERYKLWKVGGEPDTSAYPWLITPKATSE